MKNKNIKYWIPVVIVAIIIALFSTVLPAQGGYPVTNPSSLAAGSYVVVNQPGGNTTGVRADSLVRDRNGVYDRSDSLQNTITHVKTGNFTTADQDFYIGHFPDASGRIGNNLDYGFYYSPYFWGNIGIRTNDGTGNIRNAIESSGTEGKIQTNSASMQSVLRASNNETEYRYTSGATTRKISATAADFVITSTNLGIKYAADYAANYTDRTLVDKGYILTTVSTKSIDPTTTVSGLDTVLATIPDSFFYTVNGGWIDFSFMVEIGVNIASGGNTITVNLSAIPGLSFSSELDIVGIGMEQETPLASPGTMPIDIRRVRANGTNEMNVTYRVNGAPSYPNNRARVVVSGKARL
jgi:hypothetical protein